MGRMVQHQKIYSVKADTLSIMLTVGDVMSAHAQFGQLDRKQVRLAMGANWPPHWDAINSGEGIFAREQ